MVGLRGKLEAFADADAGATAIEYGLIAALIAIACIAALGVFGPATLTLFNYVRDNNANAMDEAGI